MKSLICLLSIFALGALAERPFLNEPDTGLEINVQQGLLPPLESMLSAPDFEAAARHVMAIQNYSYYRTGSAGEFEYRRALEIHNQVSLRPRLLRDVSDVSMKTKILGYEFDAPFFIAPAARAGLAHPRGELGLAEAAGKHNVLYAPSLSATKKMEETAAVKLPNQIMFHQLYVSANKTKLASDLRRIEAAGYKGIFVTVDNPIHGVRTREERYGFPNTTDHDPAFSWESYKELRKMTKLPVIPKGIQTVEDALMALEIGAPGIYLSNHGGRQLDSAPHPVEVALEIRTYAPQVYKKMTVFADGGVRYGTDVLKLLVLGVHAVGMGRPFLFSNIYGAAGVEKLMEIMKRELWLAMANTGVTTVKGAADMKYVNVRRLQQYLYQYQSGY